MSKFTKPDGSYDCEAADAEIKRLGELPLAKRITKTETWDFGDVTIIVDTINDIAGFYQRMYLYGRAMNWFYSPHLLTCQDEQGNAYIYATPYYDGCMPTETVLKLVVGTKVI